MAPIAEPLNIPVKDIAIPPGFRKSKPSKVAELADSIARDGLLQPIGVRAVPGKTGQPFSLVFGGHRLAAHKKLKRETIEARLYDIDKEQAESAMLAENLFRNPLKAADYLQATKRWQELYKIENPSLKSGPKPDVPEPQLSSESELNSPPPEPAPFFQKLSERTGLSESQAKKDAALAGKFSDADYDILREREVKKTDIEAIGEIKSPESRKKAVALVSSGMEPKLAIAVAQAPENATLTTVVQECEPSHKPEAEYTDEEWVLLYCQEMLAKLTHKSAFVAEAILWRKTRSALTELRTKILPVLRKPTTYSRSALRYRLNQVLNIAHPNKWRACGHCGGAGGDCLTCRGAGFSIESAGN